MKSKSQIAGVGLFALWLLLCGGCAGTDTRAGEIASPEAHLEVVRVRNDFDSRYLPDVTEFEIRGEGVADCSVELLYIEEGSTRERGVLDDIHPQMSTVTGRLCLIRTARPDPDGNPKSLWPRQICGFRLASRIEPLPAQSFGGLFEVWPKGQAGSSQFRPMGSLPPIQPQVLFVQWFGPLFREQRGNQREHEPPLTLQEIKQATSQDSKTSAVALIIRWNSLYKTEQEEQRADATVMEATSRNQQPTGHPAQRAKRDIAAIVTAVEAFYLEKGRYPTEEEGLGVLPVKRVSDPWGRAYSYRLIETQVGTVIYEISSLGADGTIGGEGLAADITSAEMQD